MPRAWIAAGALAAGVLLASRGPGAGFGIATAAIGGALLAGTRPRAVVVGMAAAAMGLGMWSATLRAERDAPLRELAARVPHCELRGRVLEGAGGLGTLASVDVADCDGWAPIRAAGVVIFDAGVGDGGERYRATGWLLPLRPGGFDAARSHAGADAAMAPQTMNTRPADAGPHAVAASFRNGLRRATEALEPREGALARGLTIGDTSGLDPVTLERFRRAGLSHLVAVSGSNVAIVVGSVVLLCAALGPFARTAIAGLALMLFVLVVGPDPSVLRAAAMGGIALGALAWGRVTEPLHVLGLAVLIVVGARPAMVHSVGLHLSVAATFGIVLWAAPIAARLGSIPRPVRLPLAVTLSAQAAVTPVMVGAFGQISVAGPIANLAAVPAVAPATIITLLAGLIGTWSAAPARSVARLAGPFTAWILGVGDVFGGSTWAAVEVPGSVAWLIGIPVGVAAARSVRRHRAGVNVGP